MQQRFLVLVLFFALLAGCSVNPVTGKREIVFTSSQQEIALGRQNYAPMQQSQGGIYDVDPELTRYVQTIGNKVAAQSGVALPYEFVVLNNSVPNAWALPGGKIAINRGLLTELNSESELAAVLGHEAVHAAARHSAQQQSRAMLLQVGVIGTAVASRNSDYGNLIVGGTNLLAQAGLARYGRKAELESDHYGMQYMSKAGYDPHGAVDLQNTFVRLSQGRQTDWLSGLFASHPPSTERVRANQATAASLPGGGITGHEQYRAAMARTMELKPAYDAYDEGRKALADGNGGQALEQVNKALNLFNGEAHFHALQPVTSGSWKRTTTGQSPTTIAPSIGAMRFSTTICNVAWRRKRAASTTVLFRISTAASTCCRQRRPTMHWAISSAPAAIHRWQSSTTSWWQAAAVSTASWRPRNCCAWNCHPIRPPTFHAAATPTPMASWWFRFATIRQCSSAA